MAVPVIDVSPLAGPDTGARELVAERIGRACAEVGFLMVVNHGIEPDRCAATLDWTRRLFELPEADKLAAAWSDDHPNRGYDPPGHQRLDPDAAPDHKEAWSFGPEHLVGVSGPMQGPNRWPDLPGFREAIEGYHRAAMAVCEQLLAAMARSLGLAADHFTPYHRTPVCTLRLLHYPPRPTRAGADRFGCGAHTDWGAVTVLLQDGAGSLEVQDRDGHWVPVPPEPDSLVVNVGDLLARWTNDRYTSTRHRVLGVPDRSRHSVACFYDLDHDARIECLPTCVSDDRPARYPPITAGGHLQERFEASISP